MRHTTLESIALPEHTARVSMLQKFWLAILLLQLTVIALTMSAVPKYATGESPVSVGIALAMSLLIGLGFRLVTQWERSAFARIPVSVSSTGINIDDVPASRLAEPPSEYIFAEPREALLRAVTASVLPTLIRFMLISTISFCALAIRQRGSSLVFALLLIGIALIIHWRSFPTLEEVATQLERIKGVNFVQPPASQTSTHFSTSIRS